MDRRSIMVMLALVIVCGLFQVRVSARDESHFAAVSTSEESVLGRDLADREPEPGTLRFVGETPQAAIDSSITIYATDADWHTGRVYEDLNCWDGYLRIRDDNANGRGEVGGWARFDTSGIPDGATITDVKLNFYVSDFDGTGPYVDFNEVENDPVYSSCSQTWSDITDGTTYLDNGYIFDTGWWEVDVGSSGEQDLENLLSENWFSVGFEHDDTSSYWAYVDGHDSSNRPYLVVAYDYSTNTPPDLPQFYSVPSGGSYPTKSYQVRVDYTDPDGAADLQYVYLRLAQGNNEESYRQTLMWGLAGSVYQWSDETHYLYDLSASKTPITNGYRVTWNFKINWDWHENTDVDLWAFGYDQQNVEGSHRKYSAGWTYDPDIRIYGSSENKDPVTEGEIYQVTGNVRFEGTTVAPDNWSGISVEMRKNSPTGTLLDTDTSVSSGYSVSWDTQVGDAGTYDIYIVPKNTNHQPQNSSDTYWDKENVTIN